MQASNASRYPTPPFFHVPRHLLAGVLLALLVWAPWAVAAQAVGDMSPDSITDLKTLEQQVQAVAKKATPCVVGVSGGSGVVVSKDGLILTVAHVGERAGRRVTVTFPDGRRVRGRTLGNDHGVDAGMVQLDGEGPWPHAEVGTSDDLEPGQWCVTLGYPVSFERGKPPAVRLGRILRNRSEMIFADCKIMGGDSGGPLFDLEGRVIGIGSKCDDDILLNIHVPIDSFHKNWDRLVEGEDFDSLEITFLGVEPRSDSDAEDDRIVHVHSRTAAYKAGMRSGDMVLSFDDEPVDGYDELPSLVQKRKPGDKVAVVVRRGEETLTLDVILGGKQERTEQRWPRNWRRHSTDNASAKSALQQTVSDASAATVTILSDGEPAAMGVVLDNQGHIVTKASDLLGELTCQTGDGADYAAVLVGSDVTHDLALLKTDAKGLTPAVWRSGDVPPPGSLIASVAPENELLSVGVVSSGPRRIGGSTKPEGRRGRLGVGLGAGEGGLGITSVERGSPAMKAGIQPGDRIVQIDGVTMKNVDHIIETVGANPPGRKIRLVIQREDEELELSATLAKTATRTLPQDHWGGGPFSARRSSFPTVLPHDSVIHPTECGSPLVDTDGKIVGINIARALRVTTYAIPADVVLDASKKLLAARK